MLWPTQVPPSFSSGSCPNGDFPLSFIPPSPCTISGTAPVLSDTKSSMVADVTKGSSSGGYSTTTTTSSSSSSTSIASCGSDADYGRMRNGSSSGGSAPHHPRLVRLDAERRGSRFSAGLADLPASTTKRARAIPWQARHLGDHRWAKTFGIDREVPAPTIQRLMVRARRSSALGSLGAGVGW